ncbi:MAG: HAMP domain-containing sensor histidine kinase [Balneolales bacterium]
MFFWCGRPLPPTTASEQPTKKNFQSLKLFCTILIIFNKYNCSRGTMKLLPFAAAGPNPARHRYVPEKTRRQEDRIQASRQFYSLLPENVTLNLKAKARELQARWIGVYIATEQSHLIAESGRRKWRQPLPDKTLRRLLNGIPTQHEHGFAFPMVINDHAVGYLDIEKEVRHNEPYSLDLLMAHAELITKELDNNVNKRLAEAYSRRLDLEESRTRKIEKHCSIIMDMAAHDITSPLSAIRGYLEMIEKNPIGDDVTALKNYFGKISLGINEISGILTQFEDVKVLADGDKVMEPIAANLAWIAQDITELFQAKAKNQHVELSYSCPEYPAFVLADVIKLKRAIMNLVSNAIKFSKSTGFVKVEVDTDGPDAIIRVIDNGIGIRKEKQDEVFKPFIQASGMHKDDPSSVGLGLYITTHFIHQMNGCLDLESETGVGSCFTITLPLLAD